MEEDSHLVDDTFYPVDISSLSYQSHAMFTVLSEDIHQRNRPFKFVRAGIEILGYLHKKGKKSNSDHSVMQNFQLGYRILSLRESIFFHEI